MRESVRVHQLLSSQLESLYSGFVQSRSKNYCDMQRACDEWFNFYKGKSDLADLESLYSIKEEMKNKLESLQVKKFTMYCNDVYAEFKKNQTEFGNIEYLVNLTDFIADFYEKNFIYENNNVYAYSESKVNSFVLLSFYYSKAKNILDFAKLTIDHGRRQKSLNSDRNFSNLSSNIAFSLDLQNIGQIGNKITNDAQDELANEDLHESIERYNGNFESNITLNRLRKLGLKETESKDEQIENTEGYDFLRKTCENLEMDKHNLETILDKLKSDYKKLKTEYQELKHIRNNQVKKIESLTLEVQDYQEENKTLKDQINNANSRMCVLFCENQELKNVKQQLIEVETKYNIEIIQGRKRIETAVESTKLLMQQEKESLENAHQKDLKQCNKIIENLEIKLESELQKLRLGYEDKMDMIIRENNADMKKLKSDICTLTTANENLRYQLEAASKAKLADSSVTYEFRKIIADLENELKLKEAQLIEDAKIEKIRMDKELQTSLLTEFRTDKKFIAKPEKSVMDKLKVNYLAFLSSSSKKTAKNDSQVKCKSANKSLNQHVDINLQESPDSKSKKEQVSIRKKVRTQSLSKLNKEIQTMKEVIKSINRQVSLKHMKGKTKITTVTINPENSTHQFVKRYSVVCKVKRYVKDQVDPYCTLNK